MGYVRFRFRVMVEFVIRVRHSDRFRLELALDVGLELALKLGFWVSIVMFLV